MLEPYRGIRPQDYATAMAYDEAVLQAYCDEHGIPPEKRHYSVLVHFRWLSWYMQDRRIQTPGGPTPAEILTPGAIVQRWEVENGVKKPQSGPFQVLRVGGPWTSCTCRTGLPYGFSYEHCRFKGYLVNKWHDEHTPEDLFEDWSVTMIGVDYKIHGDGKVEPSGWINDLVAVDGVVRQWRNPRVCAGRDMYMEVIDHKHPVLQLGMFA